MHSAETQAQRSVGMGRVGHRNKVHEQECRNKVQRLAAGRPGNLKIYTKNLITLKDHEIRASEIRTINTNLYSIT